MAMAGEEEGPKLADWEVLQSKIFTRWVNQRLMSRHLPTIQDVRTDLGQGEHLANLMYVLSEQDIPAARKSPSKLPMVKAQRLEVISKALQLVWDCGVNMKLKPSPENLYSGDFKDVMSLVWAIMMKYIKFDDDDDEENLTAKDALLKWLQFHTKDYPQVNITNLTKSFHDGIAFCCLMHKFKPKGIDVEGLDPANKAANLQLAMDKGEELFGIEKYLTPADVPKLDEKAMLVYCSEYYYHINEQAKRDLAAKRISKLIKFTRENDEMKASYVSKGDTLLQQIGQAEQLLQDVTIIDNTMAGAQKRLADFGSYKTGLSKSIVSLHLDMEGLFNTLALRLANHNRPPFAPPKEEMQPAALTSRVKALKSKESVEPALYAELSRQKKLVQLDTRHTTLAGKLQQWIADKDAYLKGDFSVDNSGKARQQLTVFGSFRQEADGLQAGPLLDLKTLGAELATEKYEKTDAVQGRESDIEAGFAGLASAADSLAPVLEDHLQRELFKEKTLLSVKVHSGIHASLAAWCKDKAAYLALKETVDSVQAAYIQLNRLEAFVQEQQDVQTGNQARLVKLGGEVRAAEYKTEHSAWRYGQPEEVERLEADIAARQAQLQTDAAAKRLVLDDHLAREQLRARVELLVSNHANLFTQLKDWATDKLTYVSAKEDVASSQEAERQLSLLEAFVKEMVDMREGGLASLCKLGGEIRSTTYKSEYSEWSYPSPQEVEALETELAELWAGLEEKSNKKKEILTDDRERELYAEHTRMLVQQHEEKGEACTAWAANMAAQLAEAIEVGSIADAQLLLSQLDSLNKEREVMVSSAVASLKVQGAAVLARKYSSPLSSYAYETPAAVGEREAAVDARFAELEQAATARRATLEELLVREERKEKLRLDFASQAATFVRICTDKVAEIGTVEEQKTMYGFSLAEVEAFEATLAKLDSALDQRLEGLTQTYQAVDKEMAELGVAENAYTQLTPADLAAAHDKVKAAQVQRRTAYAAELQRRRENDAKCLEFANIVKPFASKVEELIQQALESRGTEEEQLERVSAALDAAPSLQIDMDSLRTLEADILARNVVINPHTPLSTDDVQAAWDNYLQVLQQRKPYLDKVVQYKRYRGISPAQYEEMEAVFKSYDKDSSGTIDSKELRTCLFSLGEERSKKEIAVYMQQYGKDGHLDFVPFRELMITLLGDAGTRDGMLESFKLLSTGLEYVTEATLAKLLEADEVAYLRDNAPAIDGGLDFTAWVDDVCAR